MSRDTAHQMWRPDPGGAPLGGAGGRLAIGGVIQRVGDRTLVGYDGATHGQSAALRIIPDAGMAVTSLANGGNMFAFHQAVLSEIVLESAELRLPTPPVPPADPEPADARRATGRYGCHDLEVLVAVGERGQVRVTEFPLSDQLVALLSGGQSGTYVQLGVDRLIGTSRRIGVHPVITLQGDPAAPAAAIVHFGRVLQRAKTSDEATEA